MKSRVLFVIHFPPPVHGAAIIGGFIKESKIINSSYECRYINLGTSATVEEIGKGRFKKLSTFVSIILQVRRQLIAFRPDLCYLTPYSQGVGFYKDFIIIALVKLYGKKIIYHFHNKGVSLRQNRFLDNILYRFVFRKADIILISKLLYPDIRKYVPEERVYYCPNGIPDRQDKRQKSQDKSDSSGDQGSGTWNPEPGTRNPEPGILFLSHLIESKGVFILVEACRILNGRNIDFHCTMTGEEGDISVNHLKAKIEEAGLSERILITGKKSGAEKEDAFDQTDIFVHPSFNDCLPLVLLEAMQHSMPVISTFEGAIPDAVDDGATGFLVPRKDPVALADKLEVLIKDQGLRLKMGRQGRLKYEREFTLERFEKRLAEILEEAGKKD
jgi:glycosyltransferase involved in cell wall biosynthesis